MNDIRVLHRNILEVAKIFDKFCHDNQLQYFLLGGTALGAARHGGFIPWDDDFDVCMKLQDYERLLSLDDKFDELGCTLIKEYSDEFGLYFSKLKLNNSVYIEREKDKHSGRHNGVFIDIMCISPGFENSMLRYGQFVAAKILNAHALSKWGYRTDSLIKKMVMSITKYTIFPWLRTWLLSFVRQNAKKNTKIYNHFFGRAPYKHATILNEFIGNGADIVFENVIFNSFEKNNAYLSKRFGKNYMDFPSNEVRSQYPSHCIYFESREDLNYPL